MKINDLYDRLKERMTSSVVLMLFVDLFAILISIAISLLISLVHLDVDLIVTSAIWFGVSCVFYVVLFFALGISRIFWKFASLNNFLKFALVIICSSLLSMSVHVILMGYFSQSSFKLGTYVAQLAFSMLLLIFYRATVRNTRVKHQSDSKVSAPIGKKNVMIVGCGYTGNHIIEDVLRTPDSPFHIACIIDDDPNKLGKTSNNIPIVGGTQTIPENVIRFDISLIIFAISSLDAARKAEILGICLETGCTVKTAPSVTQIMSGDFEPHQTRDVDINDLLGREPINIDLKRVMSYVNDKTILVTGGGGSIGSELCRQIAAQDPKRLIIFDIYENNAYDIQNELKHDHPKLEVVTLIGSVRDSSRLDMVLEKYKPDIIYHAAAHKHVPLMEDSPNEAIKNNVLGTYKLVRAADKHKVKRFVMISTDKAVNPTNIMGATKRICEMIVQDFNTHSECEFVAVRFGNVLGSNGSVIPLFKKQIENGGPVTVTHPEIIRYFMTIPEAVSLVLQAGADAKGGEIFVLDMGKPVKIVDLAKNLIKLMGHVPDGDIKIEYTGLRPGEKLYEELLMAEEGLKGTENKRIHIGRPLDIDEKKLFDVIERLEQAMYDDSSDVRSLVKELVPTYIYNT